MAVTLKGITEDNFIDAFNLKLKKDQEEFVSHPIRSLAQAYVYRDQCQPFGIYEDDVPEYDIWHMMIDETQQGKGYGKAALKLILDYIEEKPFGNSDRVVLTCNKNNTYALNMYKSLGFEMTGNEDEDELELALTV